MNQFCLFFIKGLFCTVVIRTVKEELVEVSISWPELQIGFTQSWKLCLNLWSVKWLNWSVSLVRNFNPSPLSTSNTWLGSGPTNFGASLLKTLQEAELWVLTPILFKIHYNCREKIIFEKVCLEKRNLNFLNTSHSIWGVISGN